MREAKGELDRAHGKLAVAQGNVDGAQIDFARARAERAKLQHYAGLSWVDSRIFVSRSLPPSNAFPFLIFPIFL
jgi:hypothetical protein